AAKAVGTGVSGLEKETCRQENGAETIDRYRDGRPGDAVVEPTYQRRPVEVALPAHGVFVLESHHAPDFRMAAQCHDFLEIFYVLKGAGVFQIDGRPHPGRGGDILIVPAGRVHRIEDDPAGPLALYGICIAPQVWRHEPALVDHLPAGRL